MRKAIGSKTRTQRVHTLVMARHVLEIRELAEHELDQYGHLAQEHGCVFDSLGWTGLFGDALTRYGIHDASGGLRGGFHLFRQRKLGLA